MMEKEQEFLVNQLRIAIDRAHLPIHDPISSDTQMYQNMILLRGYLDALWKALRANSHYCESLGSMHRSLRGGLDLAGRILLCRNWCVDLSDALGAKDEETLGDLRVQRLPPMQILSKEQYGDKADKAEDGEYFARLEALFRTVEMYLGRLTEKWIKYFGSRYDKPETPGKRDGMRSGKIDEESKK